MSISKVAVLVSGGGTNLQALIDAEKKEILKSGKIRLVISNKEGAYALTRAEKAGIKKNIVKPDWIIQWVSLALKEEIKDTASTLNGDTYSEMTKKLLEDPKLFEKVAEKAANEDKKNKEIINKSNTFIEHQIKGLIARNLYGIQYYYEVLKDTDEGYKKALEVIENGRLFRKMKITH